MKLKWEKVLVILILFLAGTPGLFAAGGAAIDSGATAWMLTSTALVLLMIPDCYVLRRTGQKQKCLGTIMHSFVAMGIISVYGLSLLQHVLENIPEDYLMELNYFFLKGIDTNIMDAGILNMSFSMFQCKFAIITPALIAGAFAERVISRLTVFSSPCGAFLFTILSATGSGHLTASFSIWVPEVQSTLPVVP
jgi:Amt family ammonium transporter